MKELLQQFAAYHLWANRTITDAILQLDDHQQQQHLSSSFPSLYTTVLHMWDAESIWYQRVHKHEKIMIPSQNFNPSMKEAVNGLLSQSSLWETFVRESGDPLLHTQVEYRNLKKELFKQPLCEILMHVFNHGTYHRGQLVTMMRSLGVTAIPQTDLIIFQRLTSPT